MFTPYQMQGLTNAGGALSAYLGHHLPAAYQGYGAQASNALGEAGNALGIYGGLSSGTPVGDIGAGANAAQLAARSGYLSPSTSSTLSKYGGDLGALAGLYQGIQQGGVAGDSTAALNAARLGVDTGALPAALGPYLGYASIPLAAYNFAQYGTQSGKTGSDALTGAESGAEIGSAVAPGVGTLVGGLIGGAAGALASAFGPGAQDPENTQWNQFAAAYNQTPGMAQYLSPSQAYQNLAGVMDARNNSPGHSQPIEQVFGRMGEQNLMDQLTQYVNQAYGSKMITPGESIQQQWNSVINPWLQAKGAGIANNNTVKGVPEGNALTGDLQSLLNSWETGALTPQSQVGVAGQTIAGLTPYAGETPQMQQYWQNQARAQQIQSRDMQMQALARSNRGVNKFSEGGSMNTDLKEIYKGSYADRPGYAGGGSYYSNYSGYNNYNTPSSMFSNSSIFGTSTPFSSPYSSYYSTPSSAAYNNYNTPSSMFSNSSIFGTSTPFNFQASGAPASSGNQGTLSGLLGLLQKGGNSISSTLGALKGYAPLIPLISALSGGNQGAKAPTLPSQFSGQLYNMSTPSFYREQNPAMQNMTMQDWLTYGEHPEQQFYLNNALPATQMSAPNYQALQARMGASPLMGTYASGAGGYLPSYSSVPSYGAPAMSAAAYAANPYGGYAEGGSYGSLEHMARGGDMPYEIPTTSSAYIRGPAHGMVRGPGDGTSDNINAKLSNGEYIMDAHTVSLLGNGSNEAGARRLDQFRHNVRKDAGQKFVRGKQPMHAKTPGAYLGGRI